MDQRRLKQREKKMREQIKARCSGCAKKLAASSGMIVVCIGKVFIRTQMPLLCAEDQTPNNLQHNQFLAIRIEGRNMPASSTHLDSLEALAGFSKPRARKRDWRIFVQELRAQKPTIQQQFADLKRGSQHMSCLRPKKGTKMAPW